MTECVGSINDCGLPRSTQYHKSIKLFIQETKNEVSANEQKRKTVGKIRCTFSGRSRGCADCFLSRWLDEKCEKPSAFCSTPHDIQVARKKRDGRVVRWKVTACTLVSRSCEEQRTCADVRIAWSSFVRFSSESPPLSVAFRNPTGTAACIDKHI